MFLDDVERPALPDQAVHSGLEPRPSRINDGSLPIPAHGSRDFYDIYATATRKGLDLSLPENLELVRHIFEAKRVSLGLLAKIAETREFHRSDWDAVRNAVVGEAFDFDIYFDFVLEEVSKLTALWEE